MFKDKVLWIIGANSDIAKAFVKKYSDNFGCVVLACREPTAMLNTINEYDIQNAKVYHLDLEDLKSVKDFMENAPQPYGVVFFAGRIEYLNKVEDDSLENIQKTIAVNYSTPVVIMEKTSKILNENKEGFIALLSSAGEIKGKYSNRFYISSKRAVTTYLEGLSQHNREHNVQTMIFKLGHVDTKMLKKIEDSRKSYFIASPQKVAKFIFKKIQKNKSMTKYYRPIWKYIAKIYSWLPDSICNIIDK